ncbi:hypothetical protein L208DRAFT_1513082, partial [Tricholoma matsutake]
TDCIFCTLQYISLSVKVSHLLFTSHKHYHKLVASMAGEFSIQFSTPPVIMPFWSSCIKHLWPLYFQVWDTPRIRS